MKHLINKGLLLLSSFALIYTLNITVTTNLITVLLLSMIAGAICPALSGISSSAKCEADTDAYQLRTIKYICEALMCLYLIIAFKIHAIYMFMSIVSYDISRYRLRIPFVMLAPLTIIACIQNPVSSFLPQMCLLAFSLILSIYSCRIDNLRARLLSMRDDTAEHDLLVAQNIRQLLENQDNMILTATLSERNRIAREIHDNVGHMLTRSILQTGAIKVINHDEHLTKPLEQLQSTLDTAMDSMRKSVHDLHDESVNLRLALEDITKNVQGIEISMNYDMSDNIPKDIKYSFINIVKEAINNTLKHSNGDRMNIRLREHPAFYQLSITDNGSDIKIAGQGMGLSGIQERVNMLGGTIKLSTDKGFSLLITVMKKEEDDI